jgi:uncharacterized membrane protein SirB2
MLLWQKNTPHSAKHFQMLPHFTDSPLWILTGVDFWHFTFIHRQQKYEIRPENWNLMQYASNTT